MPAYTNRFEPNCKIIMNIKKQGMNLFAQSIICVFARIKAKKVCMRGIYNAEI